MSLKAKIEAVIYASEEPVTLAQLAGLLGHEAQAELDHLDSAQQSLTLDERDAEDEPADPDTLNREVLEENSEAQDLQDEDLQAEDLQAEDLQAEDLETLADSDAETLQAESQTESQTEPLGQQLHEAAQAEADHVKSLREHAAADEAAMSTADSLDADSSLMESPEAEPENPAPAESAAGSPAAESKEDEKKLAREAREKDRRLREYFRSILDQLIADYATSDRGLEIREVAGGYRLATKPEYHDAVRGFVKSLKPPLKLSLQALETLAVVAYKQPVTAPEVSEIRGVDSGGVLGSLMARKLVATAGRKQVIGRPILYKTTKDFLLRFGLKDINELPSIEEFEKMAGELAEQEEIPMEHHAPETPDEVEQQRDQTEPQADGDSSTPGETVADEAIVDGRLSGLPPNYDSEDAGEADSPALDAEVQGEQHPTGEE